MKKRFTIYNPIENTYMYSFNGWHSSDFSDELKYPALFVSLEQAESELNDFHEWCLKNEFHKRWGIYHLEIKTIYIH